jgi:hypothetical protein
MTSLSWFNYLGAELSENVCIVDLTDGPCFVSALQHPESMHLEDFFWTRFLICILDAKIDIFEHQKDISLC